MPTTPPNPIDLESHASSPDFEVAFNEALPLAMALPEAEQTHINVDIPHTVTKVLSGQPKLRTLRPDMARMLTTFDLAEFDRIELYAHAVAHAHARAMAAPPPKAVEISPVYLEGQTLRQGLLEDAAYLVKKERLSAERLDRITKLIGYRNVAFDLMALVALFKELLPTIEGKCDVTMPHLDRCKSVAERILAMVAERAQAGDVKSEAATQRALIYSLLFRAYDEARRATTYVRWREGDADDYCPSLFAGRKGKQQEGGKDDASPDVQPAPEPEPVVPVPAGDGESGVPGGNPFSP